MRVRMLTTAAGAMGVFPAGSVADVPEMMGEAWCAGGYAVALDPKPEKLPEPGRGVEAAAFEPSEKAVRPPVRKKRR